MKSHPNKKSNGKKNSANLFLQTSSRSLIGAFAILSVFVMQLLSCATTAEERARIQAKEDLADTTRWDARSDAELRIKDNQKVGIIKRIDSILCEHVAGVEGRVYLDEPLWSNLSQTQRLNLGECIAQKRHLTVTNLEPGTKGVRLWTARLSDDRRRLFVGTVMSDCITCTLHEGQYEYILTPVADSIEARRLTEAELWR